MVGNENIEEKERTYTELFERLSTLLSDLTHANQDLEEVQEKVDNISQRRQYLQAYLRAEINSEEDATYRIELTEELDEILNAPQYRLTIRTYPDPKIRAERANKTQMLFGVLMEEKALKGNNGLTPKEVFEVCQTRSNGKDITLQYVNNILSRFKAMGRLVQFGGKYHVTQSGEEYWNRVTGADKVEPAGRTEK